LLSSFPCLTKLCCPSVARSSHYVTVLFLFLTGYKLLIDDWRGYVIVGFSLVWIANTYMSLFGFIRQDISKEKMEIKCMEKKSEALSNSEKKV
jgi:hypothetical protein